MSKNYFTLEQVDELRKNKYVKKVSEKAITYTEAFKEVFIMEYNNGKPPSIILTEMGFDIRVLGSKRISSLTVRTKKQTLRPEGFKDTRAGKSGRPLTRELSQEETIDRQKAEIEYLKQQVEFLSDLQRLEREAIWKASKSKKKKDSK
ncbi:MAG: hypothetical protein PHD47_04805 [Acholeplasmataceae bacterium]|nr:hypothetical protein [Acholeplasmataceae bacterium]